MRHGLILCLTAVFCAAAGGAEPEKEDRPQRPLQVDPEMTEVLRDINSVSAYEVPDL